MLLPIGSLYFIDHYMSTVELSSLLLAMYLCKKNIILKVFSLFRWLQWKISDLTNPHRCAFYLHLFHESIWPNGKYDSSSREIPSEKQKSLTKSQAQRVLGEFFPGLYFFVMVTSNENDHLFIHVGTVTIMGKW